jgi:sulfur-oxidizing protein SoxY
MRDEAERGTSGPRGHDARVTRPGAGGDISSIDRRAFMRAGVIAVAGLAFAERLLAEPPALVPTSDAGPLGSGPDDEMTDEVKHVLKAKFGDRPIQAVHVQLDIPTDAPDGRAVPVILDTDLAFTSTSYVAAYHLLVDHNPDIYLAGYHLSSACGEGPVETRIKMRRTSYVRAIAEMNTGELWSAATKVFVGLNGCG